MGDEKMVSAEKARGCGDGGCVFRAPSDRGQHTNAGCRCLPLRMTPAERVGLRERIRSLVVELDGARTRLEGVGVVECLAARDAATRERERANKAERERAEAQVARDAAIDAMCEVYDAVAQAERDLLRRLWQRIDGEQEGDAPSAVEMEDGLVRLFDDMRADVERCAADENASTEEAERLREERDRLAREVERLERALRVENGDPFAGPDGWTPTTRGWRRADMLVTRRWMFGTCVRVALDEDGYIIDGSATDHPNAWDAMTLFGDEEAADAAREGSDG